MKNKNRTLMLMAVYISNFLVLLYLFFQNKGESLVLIMTLGILIGLGFFIMTYIIKIDSQKILTVFFLLAMIYWIQLIDKSGGASVYPIILTSIVILDFELNFAYIITVITLFSSFYIHFIIGKYDNFVDFLPDMLSTAYPYAIFVFIISLLRRTMDQQKALEKANKEISIQRNELEASTEKLKDNLEELEDMTIEKERNRIAREIHDTVGHTLTTVLIEIEAGKRLIEKDKDLSKQKLELAQKQVRKGLNDIRKSVRLLKEGSEVLDFMPSIKLLIEETIKHTDIEINCNIKNCDKLEGQIGKAIYHALQEGLTNGMKHGGANIFNFKLKKDDKISFFLLDNGEGMKKDSIMGFGLSAMEDRVNKLNGKIAFKNTTQGFLLEIQIPMNGCEIDD
jgi:signal transduction histidine kinase